VNTAKEEGSPDPLMGRGGWVGCLLQLQGIRSQEHYYTSERTSLRMTFPYVVQWQITYSINLFYRPPINLYVRDQEHRFSCFTYIETSTLVINSDVSGIALKKFLVSNNK